MKKQKAFTLIELLVVIAVIGLLASMVLVNVTSSRDSARVAKSLEFSQSLHNRLGVDAVGVWDFDEGSGTTARDGSGFGNNGIIPGAAYNCNDTPHKVVGRGDGKCSLSFDGNDYITALDSVTLDPQAAITISAWIKTGNNYAGTNGYITRKGSEASGVADYGFSVSGSPGYLKFDFYNAGWKAGVLDNFKAVTYNKWHFVVVTYNKTNYTYYIDGAVGRSVANTNAMVATSQNLYIGNDLTAYYFNGLIDEVRVYTMALTVGQIQQLYAEGFLHHQLAEK